MSSRDVIEIRPSRAGSAGSARSARSARSVSRGSEKDQALSVNIWGRGDRKKGDPRSHWAVMTYDKGATEGDIYHTRKGDLAEYYYERSRRPVVTTSSFGRSEVAMLSRSQRERAASVLDTYGNNRNNVPDGHSRRCQEWTVGSLEALEEDRLIPPHTSKYWRENIGSSAPDIGSRLQRDGRSWIPRERAEEYVGPVDARFGERSERRTVGRLNMGNFSHLTRGRR